MYIIVNYSILHYTILFWASYNILLYYLILGPMTRFQETPDPALADFCREADDLLSAHFDEEAFQNHSAADLLQIPSILQEYNLLYYTKIYYTMI